MLILKKILEKVFKNNKVENIILVVYIFLIFYNFFKMPKKLYIFIYI